MIMFDRSRRLSEPLRWGRRETLATILEELDDVLPAAVVAELERWRASRLNYDFLSSVGRVWSDSEGGRLPALVLAPSVNERLAEAETALARRSFTLVASTSSGSWSPSESLQTRPTLERKS